MSRLAITEEVNKRACFVSAVQNPADGLSAELLCRECGN